MHGFAVQQDLAARGRKIAGDDLHERGLAGAIVAHEPDDLASFEREVDVRQRLDGAEMLRDALQFENSHRSSRAQCRLAVPRRFGPSLSSVVKTLSAGFHACPAEIRRAGATAYFILTVLPVRWDSSAALASRSARRPSSAPTDGLRLASTASMKSLSSFR